jgi:lipoyl(octanoyl) transferase
VPKEPPPELLIVRLPTLTYAEGLELQRAVRDARAEGSVPDVLLLLEHWPVCTKGRRSEPEELAMGEEWYRMQGIEICETDRGGRVTYHGPGQLVAYPIIGLRSYGDDIHAYVRRLERVAIEALGEHGVPTQVFDGLTGIWTAGQPPIPTGHPGPQDTPVGAPSEPGPEGARARKIGSIGVHVSRGITTHGLAINVNNDLQPFEWIVPCGIDYVRMTSLSREHGSEQDLEAFASTVAERFATVFDRTASWADPDRLPQPASPQSHHAPSGN